jgi:hypothetical protein
LLQVKKLIPERLNMLKQLQDKEIARLKSKLQVANNLIKELTEGYDCPNEEIRMLVRDLGRGWIKSYSEKE